MVGKNLLFLFFFLISLSLTPSRTKYKTCQRAEELLSQSHPYLVLTAFADVLLQSVAFPRRLVAGFALWPPRNTSLCKTHCCVFGMVLRCHPPESPRVNLRLFLRVGACSVLSLRDGDKPGICLGYGLTATPGVLVES